MLSLKLFTQLFYMHIVLVFIFYMESINSNTCPISNFLQGLCS